MPRAHGHGRRRAVHRRRPPLPTLLVGQAMASFDGSVVTVAAPSIRADLHASGPQLQLLSSGYLMAFAVLIVPGARLGDRFGHSRVFAAGLALFTLTSAMCGAAWTPTLLAAARTLQGAAAAAMLPQVLSVVQLSYTGTARERAIGWYSAVLAVGVVLGQVLGGLLISADVCGLGWRSVFLVNVAIGAVLLAPARALPPLSGRPAVQLDLPGAALLAGATAPPLLALLFGRQEGWPRWLWPALIGAVACAGSFGWWQRRQAARHRSPLLDLSILAVPGVARRLAAASLVMGAYAGTVFVLALHLQSGLGLSAVHAGLAFSPYAVGFAAASVTVPRVPLRRLARLLPVVGALMFGTALCVVAATTRTQWPIAGESTLLLAAGSAHAATFGPVVARLAAPLRKDQAAPASALVSTCTLFAEALGVAVIGGVYLSGSDGSANGLTGLIAALSLTCVTAAVLAADPRGTPRRTGAVVVDNANPGPGGPGSG